MMKPRLPRPGVMALAAVVFSALLAGDVRAASLATELFVGKDSLETLTRGTYAGLRNPNYGRLTLLFNHDDHFHGIGVHSYTGTPPDDVSVQRTNANNRIPEGYSGVPPVVLAPGDGLYAGKLVNRASEEEYTNTHIESVHRIPAAPEGLYDPSLFNSSNDRWSAPLDETIVALQLVSITPGLNVGGETSLNLFEDGHNHVLGDGNSLSVPLFFWTEADAPVGAYAAEFRLIDLGLAGLDPSGTFHLDFQVVPLPAAAWLFASAVLALGGLAGQKRLADRKAAGQPAS